MILTLPAPSSTAIDYGRESYRPVPDAMPGAPAAYGIEEPPVMAAIRFEDMFRFFYRASRVVVQASFTVSGDGYEETGQGSFTATRRPFGYTYPEDYPPAIPGEFYDDPVTIRALLVQLGGLREDPQIRGEIPAVLTIDGNSQDYLAEVRLSGFVAVAQSSWRDVSLFAQAGRYSVPRLLASVGPVSGRVTGNLFGNPFRTPAALSENPDFTYEASLSVDFAGAGPANDLPF